MTNDEMMIYNERSRRYVLTEQCALALNIDLQASLNSSGVPFKNKLAAQILDRVSRTVYNFIFLHGDRAQKTSELEREDEYYRPFIKEALEEQLLYFMANGDINAVSRVNMQSGQEISRAAKLDAAYAPEMENILAQSGILFCGR